MKSKLSTFQVFFILFITNSAIVVLIIWVFFTFFSHKYYINKVLSSFVQDSINHENLYADSNPEELFNMINIFELNKECRILLLDTSKNSIVYPQLLPGREMVQSGYGNMMEIREVIAEVMGKIAQTPHNNFFFYIHPRVSTEMLVVFRKWDNNIVWICQTAVQPIHQAVNIFQSLFLWFGLLGLFISGILSWILSYRITGSVDKLNEKVLNIATLSFRKSKIIKVGFSKELEIVGNTLDTVSDQLSESIYGLEHTNLRLKQELSKEKQLDSIRKQFITDVSHDLKTPISIIQGYTEGLLDGIPHNADEYITAIQDEAHYMKKLVDSLLELARLESEQSFMHFEEIDIKKLVLNIFKRLSAYAKSNNRKVSLHSTASSAWYYGDIVKLGQAFENLLRNSISHGDPNGEIKVELDIKNGIMFSVYNDGPSIPNNEIPMIFERFYRLDRSRNRQTGGTGLGLSISKKIVEKHNGEIGVSNEAHGVRFWIRLPILNKKEDDHDGNYHIGCRG